MTFSELLIRKNALENLISTRTRDLAIGMVVFAWSLVSEKPERGRLDINMIAFPVGLVIVSLSLDYMQNVVDLAYVNRVYSNNLKAIGDSADTAERDAFPVLEDNIAKALRWGIWVCYRGKIAFMLIGVAFLLSRVWRQFPSCP
jgi:hypothetical protein